MIPQRLLKIGSVLIVGVLVALLLIEIQRQSGSQVDPGEPHATSTQAASLQLGEVGRNSSTTGIVDRKNDSRSSTTNSRSRSSLRIGKIGATPNRDEISSITTLPILESQIHRLYAMAKDASCRVLVSGAAVLPTLPQPQPGQAFTIGRVPSITVGLEMATAGRSKLPAVTRGQVDEYFRKHRLSIQPVVYCDESGQTYFGTDCQAAFYEIDRPGTAVQPEPMIDSAVARFRSLGVFRSSDESEAAAGRTLTMAFAFEKSDDLISEVRSVDRQATELLFFHLPSQRSTAELSVDQREKDSVIEMEAFLTSDDRRTLHRLDLQGLSVNSPMPTISADIRFDKMILMGMYPAEPVVTQIHYRSAGVVSMELVQKLLEGSKERSELSLSDVLDQFSLLSQSRLDSAPTGSAKNTDAKPSDVIEQSDEQWYREMARRKYDRLEQSLQPLQKRDDRFSLPRVPRVTGVK